MKNIIGSYNASDLGFNLNESDFGIAYLHEERGYNDQVQGYWWLDSTHHDLGLSIYKTQEEAVEALRNWADLSV